VATALVDITPNPFNPQTKITYNLTREGRVQLKVYDLQGYLVRSLVDGSRSSGRHTETWNGIDDAGSRVASGLCVARLTTAGGTQMMKMTLLKPEMNRPRPSFMIGAHRCYRPVHPTETP